MPAPTRRWDIPRGLRVGPDGKWTVGEYQVIHPPTLRYLKSHLVFEQDGAFIVDGTQRVPIEVAGPPFEALTLVVDDQGNAARVILDDGSEEPLSEDGLGMDETSGRFECAVRGGKARAILSRSAHQTLLQRVTEENGRFVVRAGQRAIPVRI